ncbi:MAG: helix-turn-helix transcriptional regulator [Eubacteriales bacterium]|nr:helix-turn-helix transcriptional regulator [Eubacteriales bacterium]
METYEKIKQLRLRAGLSQNELAKKAGYTDRSSIAKIEAGSVDLTETKIIALSKALEVTPATLMCLEDAAPEVSREKQQLLNLVEGMTDDQAEKALELIKIALQM